MIAGVDYSLTSPACCILKDDKIIIHCVTTKKPLVINYLVEPFHIITHLIDDKFSSFYSRVNILSDLFFEILKEVPQIAFEDYSFGSKGRVFAIAENTGYLKQRLHNNSSNLYLYAPTQIKKYATGKGNAKKDQMIESFKEKFNIDLFDIFNINKQKSSIAPIPDIVDSYYVMEFLKNNLLKEEQNANNSR